MAAITLLAETAADLMTPNPVSLSSRVSAAEAAQLLTTRSFSAAVVIDDAGHPVGVVTKTDLLTRAFQREPKDGVVCIDHLMTTAVFTIRPDTSARSVIAQFLALNVHHLFVADASGVVIGVISPMDILRRLS